MANIKISDLDSIEPNDISSSRFLVSLVEDNKKTSHQLKYSDLCTQITLDIQDSTTNSIADDVEELTETILPNINKQINNLTNSINELTNTTDGKIPSLTADDFYLSSQITSLTAKVNELTNMTDGKILCAQLSIDSLQSYQDTLKNTTIPKLTGDVSYLSTQIEERFATSENLGMIKLFKEDDDLLVENGYRVQLDDSKRAYVTVPPTGGGGSITDDQINKLIYTNPSVVALQSDTTLLKEFDNNFENLLIGDTYKKHQSGTLLSVSTALTTLNQFTITNYPILSCELDGDGNPKNTNTDASGDPVYSYKSYNLESATVDEIGYIGILTELMRYVGQKGSWPTNNTFAYKTNYNN